MSAYILICIYIINWSSILIISPVDTPNKIFDSNDKKYQKKEYINFLYLILYLQFYHFCYTGIKDYFLLI